MEAQLRVIEIKIIELRDNIKDQNQGLFYLTITIYKTLLQTAQTEKKNRRFPCSKLKVSARTLITVFCVSTIHYINKQKHEKLCTQDLLYQTFSIMLTFRLSVA